MTAPRKRVAILISGRGSNMVRLIEAAAEPNYPAEVVGVISDQADAPGLRYAESRQISTRVVTRAAFADKAAHDAAIDAEIAALDAELVCLAGYMRVLTPGFAARWQGRIINIHPALLPMLKGLDTHRRALDAGLRIHGCTVHFVTAETDDGPIIAQAAVAVMTDDTEAALAARVLKAEHELYPLALALVAGGHARMQDGRTVFSDLHETSRQSAARLFSPSGWSGAVDLEALARFTP